MIWLTHEATPAAALPAAWLVETAARPGNLGERSLVRRAVARDIIAMQFAVPVARVALEHDGRGRPAISGGAAALAGVHLSYATRDGAVLVALDRRPLGADVERIESLPDIPWNVLHPLERDALRSCPEAERNAAFHLLWAGKEACLKASGEGLAREPASFALRFSGARARCDLGPGLVVETRVLALGERAFACAVARQE